MNQVKYYKTTEISKAVSVHPTQCGCTQHGGCYGLFPGTTGATGRAVAEGTPEDVMGMEASSAGYCLKEIFKIMQMS